MSAHDCTTLNPGCFRCQLNMDEIDHDRLDHLRVAKLLRGQAKRPDRRPGTRSLLLDLAEELTEKADEMAALIGKENYRGHVQ